jgi:hypothetical protein
MVLGEVEPTKSARNYGKFLKVCQHMNSGYAQIKTGTCREFYSCQLSVNGWRQQPKKTNKGLKPLEDHGDKEKETYNKTM